MSTLATLTATAVSLAALSYLATTDPKRRRTFRLPPVARRDPRAAWALALAPGALLPLWSGPAGFFIWLGATAVAGWALAATSPGRTAAGFRLVGNAAEATASRFASLVAKTERSARCIMRASFHPSHRIADLEHRIRQLEQEVAALRTIDPSKGAPAGIARSAGQR